MFNIGDYVSRISHNNDIAFQIMAIEGNIAYLKGVDVRLYADSEVGDLVKLDTDDVRASVMENDENIILQIKNDYIEKGNSNPFFIVPGNVLHIDGDEDYLKRCMRVYERLNVPALGIRLSEQNVENNIVYYLNHYKPKIVVVTGHDSYFGSKEDKDDKDDLLKYRNSVYFVKVVDKIRSYEQSLNDMVVIAGACQSNFEALINAGANFASSPKRVNIHALDPTIIACIVSYTSFNDNIDLKIAISKTITGKAGIGGIQTKGLMRLGFPK